MLKARSPAHIASRIEVPHLSGYIWLEGAVAQNQKGQGRIKQDFRSHEEVPQSHERTAKDYGTALAEDAVGQDPTEKRCKINQACIQAIDMRGVGMGIHQVLDHVINQKRPHAIIGKPLPHLGEEKDV